MACVSGTQQQRPATLATYLLCLLRLFSRLTHLHRPLFTHLPRRLPRQHLSQFQENGAHRLPHCCEQNMDLDGVLPHLPADLADFFRSKREELEDGRRKYCYVLNCSAYIPPRDREGDVGFCGRCQARTCLLCNRAVHPGTECEVDEELKRVLETAEEEGWRRCTACGRVVELKGGCNHVT